MKKYILISLLSFSSGLMGAYTFHHLNQPDTLSPSFTRASYHESDWQLSTDQVSALTERELESLSNSTVPESDFVKAAKKSIPSVVFIKTVIGNEYEPTSYFDLLFGRRSGPMATSGSGVIYSEDGYIVTNSHVIEGANKIEVVHNKRTYPATLIGTDPSTDLAVLKVNTTNLPAITLGRSANVQVGEWAIAVGNPFNLTSTVTAGIISAKGRDINILKSNFPIESFIQTDAAINPGNSGGALVNINGELIGINTAILSQTGSYAGYGFAVPVDVVRKVVDDMINYGEVQKAFIGAEVIDLDLDKAEQLNVKAGNGVVVTHVIPSSAADKANLKAGDIIIAVNDQIINSRNTFYEILSYYSPGDKIDITYIRSNQKFTTAPILTNREGTTEILKREVFSSKSLGADLEKVSKVERDLLGIAQGVRITNIQKGFIKRLGIEEGFVVTEVNNTPIDTPQKLVNILSQIRGEVIIKGISRKGVKGYYSYYF